MKSLKDILKMQSAPHTLMILLASAFLTMLLTLPACSPTSPGDLKKVLKENPDIITEVIKENPRLFMDTLNEAARNARAEQRKSGPEERQKQIEEDFKSPKTPAIEPDRVIFGKVDAPITIVEYSDFECPYCARGFQAMQEVKNHYGDKVRVVFKHLPLSFHPLAKPAAQYFEAIALEDHKKAEKFHQLIFENQSEFKEKKEQFLKEAAKKVGVSQEKISKNLKSDSIEKRIRADMSEAQKYGITGTPAFIVNGVALKGAYPFSEFQKVIDRLLAEKDSAKPE